MVTSIWAWVQYYCDLYLRNADLTAISNDSELVVIKRISCIIHLIFPPGLRSNVIDTNTFSPTRASNMSANSNVPETCGIPGEPRTTKSQVLEASASMVQDFTPVKQICAFLNAFHVYADDPTRSIEANHYCTHLTEGRLIWL